MSRVERVNDLLRRIEDETRTAFDEHAQLLQENAKLFALLKHESEQTEKLRELAEGIGHLLFSLDVDYCATCPRDGINHPCPVYTVDGGECLYKTDMRELGIEVVSV